MQTAALAKSYRAAAVTTASPGQLVLMLFDGALRFATAARQGFAESQMTRRNEQIHNNLIKAQKILRELQCSLDHEAGGEFSATMYRLYDYMTTELQNANLEKSAAPIVIVEELLGQLRDSWAQMLQENVRQTA